MRPRGAQGTIEYLVILAVIIVLALIIVGVLLNTEGNFFDSLSGGGAKAFPGGSNIIITDGTLGDSGSGVLALRNESGETLTLNSLEIGSRTNTYSASSATLANGAGKNFSFSSSGGDCDCANIRGNITCSVVMNVTTASGLTKAIYKDIPINCAGDSNVGGGGAVGPVSGCGAGAIIGTAVSTCRTLSASGNYTITANLADSGTCLRVTADDVNINGGQCAIMGNIDASNNSGDGYTGLVLNDLNVVGDVNAYGASTFGGSITLRNSIVSGSVIASGADIGGDVSLTDSNTGSIDNSGVSNSGSVTLSNSHVGTISSSSMTIAGVSLTNSTATSIDSHGLDAGTITESFATNGGNVLLVSSIVGTVSVQGGSSNIDGYNGAVGGSVNSAGSVVTLINALGGGCGSVTTCVAGMGGVVSLSGGSANTINAVGGTSSVGNYSEQTGGNGGTVEITNATVGLVNASGGDTYAYTTGGNGGTINFYGTSTVSDVLAECGQSGVPGNLTGGTVTFENCPDSRPAVNVGCSSGYPGTITPENCNS